MTLCEPCTNAARDLCQRMLGIPQRTAQAQALRVERVMQAYRALHRRHETGRQEGQRQGARWAREEARPHG